MGLHDLKDRFDNIEIIEVSSKLALNPLNENTIDLELIKRDGVDKNKTKTPVYRGRLCEGVARNQNPKTPKPLSYDKYIEHTY